MKSKTTKTNNGKNNTYFSYALVGDGGVITQNILTRDKARTLKRNLTSSLGLKNKDISIIQTAVSNVR